MTVVTHDLEQDVLEAVSRAYVADEPVELGRGPFFDRRLKRLLGITRVHQSSVCAAMNRLVEAGEVVLIDTGAKMTLMCGERTKEYPVLQYLPA